MFGPIRSLILAAALFLPLAFFVWFAFAQTLVLPVVGITKTILFNWLPEVFKGVEMNKYAIDWITTLPVDAETLAQAGGRKVGAVMTVNPMIYGYGLPVVAGLTLATPISIGKRAWQIAIAAVVIWMVQANGVIWESIVKMGFQSGPEGAKLIANAGLNPEFVAFAYQFSYLIIPAITPVILWCVLNRKFIEQLIMADKFEDIVDENDPAPSVMTHMPDAPEAQAESSAVPKNPANNPGQSS